AEEDEDALWKSVLSVLAEATDRFIAMRAGEGERMTADITSRLSFLEESVGKIEATSGERVQKYTDRLYEKLKTLLEDRAVDESRILTEAAIFADKTAVDEETVRLRSHIQQYREILAAGGPVGRKLDFLTQELNRETNTIGSKCQELTITRMVVDMKAEIEKIREQIQNLE
ncbi:MAG: YicC/YloC family endoribonuclease, partial [Pygmaiobacter massiliensis]